MKRQHIGWTVAVFFASLSFLIFTSRHWNPELTAVPRNSGSPGPAEIVAELKKASTGNIADAVDEATGQRGFMVHDMKPVFKTKIAGPAATAVLRPVLKTDKREYPNYALQILDEAPPGSVLVYVLEDGMETAGIGNLMSTTAKVRGLAGAVIDGGARDIDEIEEIGFPVFSRSVTPATSVGRYVSVAKQVPVTCGGVLVRPGDYVVGDVTGVVVIPGEKVAQVVDLLRQYDEKENKMIPIIKEQKSMLKALERYNRY
ncbi:MAG TPA: RraA family protein [Terriglobia bacterium]|nr:RraA family protein [Terriglobia bacterium]